MSNSSSKSPVLRVYECLQGQVYYGRKARDLVALAERRGWRFMRLQNRSSHRIYRHPKYAYTVSIPDHGSVDLAAGIHSKLVKQIEGTWRGAPAALDRT